jgi:hypothetical protein
MKCFEVMINGTKVCTAGVGHDGVLAAILTLVHRQNVSDGTRKNQEESKSLDIRVGGMANVEPGVSEHVEWLHQYLSVGDEITIKIIESSECNEPLSRDTNHLQCSFCEKKQAEVSKLIAGPQVFICDECILICSQVIADGEPSGKITLIPGEQAEVRCSFCGKNPVEVNRIVGVPAARICNECIKICDEILKADRTG